MAKVNGPLMSLSASGTVGKAFTFGIWKGIAYVRKWFKPENPQTAEQVNLQTALTLMVELWQTKSEEAKQAWEDALSGQQYSGYNLFMSRGLKAYIAQLGVATTPVSVSYVTDPPDEVWTWSDV